MVTSSTANASIPSNLGKGKEKLATSTNSSLPWVEKYRPKGLEDLISHQDIISTIRRFIKENRLPHLLFYGPPGTGKTSTILACAKELYGSSFKSMILELNASDDRGIDVVREQIRDFASTRKMFAKGFKLIILDEADAMTQVAQAALRRMIERYTKNVRFCIICNYVSKIIPALQSRCTRFRFAPLSRDQMCTRLDYIVRTENVKLSSDGEEALLRLSKGDMRRVLNVLQACHAAIQAPNTNAADQMEVNGNSQLSLKTSIDEDLVYRCTGNPLPKDVETMAQIMLDSDFTAAFDQINALKIDRGYALADIISDIYEYLMGLELPPNCRVFLLQHLSDIESRLAGGANETVQLCALIGAFKVSNELLAKHRS